MDVSPPLNFTSFLLFSVVNRVVEEADCDDATANFNSKFWMALLINGTMPPEIPLAAAEAKLVERTNKADKTKRDRGVSVC